jgi:hypothetical protein
MILTLLFSGRYQWLIEERYTVFKNLMGISNSISVEEI